MYYGAERKTEGLKAVLSIAAIAAGLLLSSMAASPALYVGSGTVDVVGVWRWVSPDVTRPDETPVFEIRRDSEGRLKATILVRSSGHVHGADVSFDEGHVCLQTEDGASFKGELSDDGTRIQGVIHYGQSSSTALFERVEHRKLRKAAARRAYAT
jgi:hypothetical protein